MLLGTTKNRQKAVFRYCAGGVFESSASAPSATEKLTRRHDVSWSSPYPSRVRYGLLYR